MPSTSLPSPAYAGRHVRPALTTVRQPMRDIGEIAVRTLRDRSLIPTRRATAWAVLSNEHPIWQ